MWICELGLASIDQRAPASFTLEQIGYNWKEVPVKMATMVAVMFATAVLAASCRDQESAHLQEGASRSGVDGPDGPSLDAGIGGRGGRAGSGPGGGRGGAGGMGLGGGVGGAGGAGGPSQ
jgi:hypothetical protein